MEFADPDRLTRVVDLVIMNCRSVCDFGLFRWEKPAEVLANEYREFDSHKLMHAEFAIVENKGPNSSPLAGLFHPHPPPPAAITPPRAHPHYSLSYLF